MQHLRNKPRSMVSLALLAAAAAAASSPSAPCQPFSPEQERDLTPHLACTPAAAEAPSRLVVFFPGTGGKPAGVETWANFSAASGLHTLVLAYPNEGTVGGLCAAFNQSIGVAPRDMGAAVQRNRGAADFLVKRALFDPAGRFGNPFLEEVLAGVAEGHADAKQGCSQA